MPRAGTALRVAETWGSQNAEYPPRLREIRILYDRPGQRARADMVRGFEHGRHYIRRYDKARRGPRLCLCTWLTLTYAIAARGVLGGDGRVCAVRAQPLGCVQRLVRGPPGCADAWRRCAGVDMPEPEWDAPFVPQVRHPGPRAERH